MHRKCGIQPQFPDHGLTSITKAIKMLNGQIQKQVRQHYVVQVTDKYIRLYIKCSTCTVVYYQWHMAKILNLNS